MNKTISFDNPKDFLTHLKLSMENFNKLSEAELQSLLMGSISALEQLWTAQNFLASRLMSSVDCLNSPDSDWAEKLHQLYTILECGAVSLEEMREILKREVCGS